MLFLKYIFTKTLQHFILHAFHLRIAKTPPPSPIDEHMQSQFDDDEHIQGKQY
jgi:hypothetical protein